jgi:hypothetical protein
LLLTIIIVNVITDINDIPVETTPLWTPTPVV